MSMTMRQADEFWWGQGTGGDKGEALLPALWHTQTSRASGVQHLVLTFKCSKKKGNWLSHSWQWLKDTQSHWMQWGRKKRTMAWNMPGATDLCTARNMFVKSRELLSIFFFLLSCSSVFLLKAKLRASTVRVLVYIQWNWHTLVSLVHSL